MKQPTKTVYETLAYCCGTREVFLKTLMEWMDKYPSNAFYELTEIPKDWGEGDDGVIEVCFEKEKTKEELEEEKHKENIQQQLRYRQYVALKKEFE